MIKHLKLSIWIASFLLFLLAMQNCSAAVAHVQDNAGSCLGGTTHFGNMAAGCPTTNTTTFTFTATNANDGIIISIFCAGAAATAVTLSATGWTITQVGSIAGSDTDGYMALFRAYSPNTSAATVTETWTVTGSNCHSFLGDLMGEFSGVDQTNFVDASNSGLGSAGCTGAGTATVTPNVANDAIWFACTDSVTATGSPYTTGGNDGSEDWAEWKILSGGSGVAQSAVFTSSGAMVIWGVAIKPASGAVANVPQIGGFLIGP